MEELTHPDNPDMMYIFWHEHITQAKEMLENKDLSKIFADTKTKNSKLTPKNSQKDRKKRGKSRFRKRNTNQNKVITTNKSIVASLEKR